MNRYVFQFITLLYLVSSLHSRQLDDPEIMSKQRLFAILAKNLKAHT